MTSRQYSKFRHTFGKALKKDQCYEDIPVTRGSSTDNQLCCVNPKFIAVITEGGGGGSFLVLPLSKTGRLLPDHPRVTGHTLPVLDLKWCPFDDNIIASCSEDSTIKIWDIPNEGITSNLETCIADLREHQRRVNFIHWHPSANNVLLSAGYDFKIYIWNVLTGQPIVELDFPEILFSASWNYSGDKIATICKDLQLRILDARTGEVLKSGQAHGGKKPQQVVYLKDGKLFTTGFDRMSERRYAVWDEDTLKQLHLDVIDTSNSPLVPTYDPDVNLLYLSGKGDCLIRYYEMTDKPPYAQYLNLFNSSQPARGYGFMPKRGLDVNKCEIARFYKLHQDWVEVIPMTVPRKSDQFQKDLYPETLSTVPALTAEEWFGGKSAKPNLMDVQSQFDESKVESTESRSNMQELLAKRRSKVIGGGKSNSSAAQETNVSTPSRGSSTPAATTRESRNVDLAPAPSSAEIESLKDDIRKLKIIAKGHERRIKTLEDKLAYYEKQSESDDGSHE